MSRIELIGVYSFLSNKPVVDKIPLSTFPHLSLSTTLMTSSAVLNGLGSSFSFLAAAAVSARTDGEVILSANRNLVVAATKRKSWLVRAGGDLVDPEWLHDASSSQSSCQDKVKRRFVLVLVSLGVYPTLNSSAKSKSKSPYDERRLLEQNKRIQRENNAPDDFPSFVREGFEVKVVASENYIRSESGLVYRDYEVGKGDCPKAGQQVTFHYIGYNESGRRIDSTYLQGSPAKIRFGTNGLVPGFEEGIRDMKPGGKRRIIIPPALGPPVGPSTFFSAKQFEVFDIELLGIKDCERRTIGFYSDVVCN